MHTYFDLIDDRMTYNIVYSARAHDWQQQNLHWRHRGWAADVYYNIIQYRYETL